MVWAPPLEVLKGFENHVPKVMQNDLPQDLPNDVQIVKNRVWGGSGERRGAKLEKGRKCDPPGPPQEGSRLHESTVFTLSLFLQKIYQKESKSSQNGGPKPSKNVSEPPRIHPQKL